MVFEQKRAHLHFWGAPEDPKEGPDTNSQNRMHNYVFGVPPGPQMDVQGHPKMKQNSSDTIDLLISFCIEFR